MGAALPVALGLQVAGASMAAKSARDQGNASADYYNFLGMNSDQNADLALAAGDRASRDVQDKGFYDSGRLRETVKTAKGSQDAAIAANGIDGSVTSEDIARSSKAKAALDELAIRYNADQKSGEIKRGAEFDANNLRLQGQGYRLAGSQARAAGKASAILSLVGGASQVATTAYGARR